MKLLIKWKNYFKIIIYTYKILGYKVSSILNRRIKMKVVKINNNLYKSEEYTIQRDCGKIPSETPFSGMWVIRDNEGKVLDSNQYRYDLFDAYNLKVEE
jgi:hypothetical protein